MPYFACGHGRVTGVISISSWTREDQHALLPGSWRWQHIQPVPRTLREGPRGTAVRPPRDKAGDRGTDFLETVAGKYRGWGFGFRDQVGGLCSSETNLEMYELNMKHNNPTSSSGRFSLLGEKRHPQPHSCPARGAGSRDPSSCSGLRGPAQPLSVCFLDGPAC